MHGRFRLGVAEWFQTARATAVITVNPLKRESLSTDPGSIG